MPLRSNPVACAAVIPVSSIAPINWRHPDDFRIGVAFDQTAANTSLRAIFRLAKR